MPRMRGQQPFACNCNVALRINSTGFCKAIARLMEIEPETARTILDEANEHARRLRAACPHDKGAAIC
jgi:hypothetical protein